MIRDSANQSDVLSIFFEDGETESFHDEDHGNDSGSGDDGHTVSNKAGDAENKAFWETQYQLLHETLDRTTSIERRIHTDTEEALRSIQSLGAVCSCSGSRPIKELCRNCILGDISDRLQELGYNSALCKSRWRRFTGILSGEHRYIDVVVHSEKGPARVVIELSFRAEFEMARASLQYNSLVGCLPEVFVGNSEKLQTVIKIVCVAAKKCTKENKMHLGPWRKHKYMQSKWFGTCQRMTTTAPLLQTLAAGVSIRQPKPRTSMLTFDLHRTAVEAV